MGKVADRRGGPAFRTPRQGGIGEFGSYDRSKDSRIVRIGFGKRRNKEMGKLNIRPLGDKVIVKRVQAEEKSAGGILLPDTAKEKPKRGVVLAVGTGRLLDDGRRSDMQVKKNDEVLFTSYAGTEIKVEGEEYMIMDESDILGVVGA
jgi:chaperonin GroES